MVDDNYLTQEAKKIAIDGTLQLLSDSYAFMFFILLPFFLNKLHSDSENAAASGLSVNFLNFLLVSVISFLFGISPTVGDFFSKYEATENSEEKNILREKIQSHFHNGFIFSFAIATPSVVMPLLFSEYYFVNFENQDPVVAAIAGNTLREIAPLVPPTFLTLLLTQFFISYRKTKIMLAGIACLTMGLSCAAVSGFGLLGFSKSDKEGVLAFYNLISYATCFIYSAYIAFHKDFKEFQFFQSLLSHFSFNLVAFSEFLKSGLIQFIRIVSELFLSFKLTAYANNFGIDQQGGFALATQSALPNAIVAIQYALAGMSALCVARMQYENQSINIRERIFKIATIGVVMTVLVSNIIPFIFSVSPELVNSFYPNQNQTVKNVVTQIMPYIAIVSSLEGLTFATMIQTQVMINRILPMLLRCISVLLGYPIALGLSQKYGIEGLAIGMIASSFLSAGSSVMCWLYDAKRIVAKNPEVVLKDNVEESFSSAKQLITAGTFKLQASLRSVFEGDPVEMRGTALA